MIGGPTTGLRRRARIASNAVRHNVAARRDWRQRAVNDFTDRGFEVIPAFLDRAECERLVAVADELLAGPGGRIDGECYVWVKARAAHGRNTQVREIVNLQDADPGVASLLAGGTIQQLFTERLGERVELYGFGLQVDGVDTSTKRGFHVDVLHPPLVKAFIYLTDVDDDADGPYTIVPGSHRGFGRKAANDLINAVTTGANRDMPRFVDADRAVRVLGPAGTLVLSTQDAIHCGGGDQSRRPRYALIAQGTTASWFRGGAITDGIESLD